MKIVHIVRQFSPSVGGLEASVLSLARAQRNGYGVDARVVTLNRLFGQKAKLPATGTVENIPVTRLAWRGSTRYPLAPSVLGHLQSADVVHVHAIDFFFDFLALTRLLHGRTMIVSTHGGFFHTTKFVALKKLWFNSFSRLSVLAYHRIVACSHSDADLFRKHAGSRLAIIENGVDQDKFSGAAAKSPARTIIYFGRLSLHKHVAQLFPILAALAALNPAWRLIVAGRDADQTAAALMGEAEEAGVANSVRLVSSPSDDQLRALIGEASYFACLSSYEGFGLAAVEAMSAGLLPVLSDIPPFRRLVAETGLGLIVNPGDPVRAALAIEASVLEDENSYGRRQAQIANAVRHYDWEQVAAKYIDIYDAALLAKGSAPLPVSLGSGV